MYHNNILEKQPNFHSTTSLSTYSVHVTAIGGRAVIGRVTRKVAEYWNQFDRDDLADILIIRGLNINETVDGVVIDPDFTSRTWTDVCDEVNLDGPVLEWVPRIVVIDANGKTILDNDLDYKELPIEIHVNSPKLLSSDSSYFIGRTGDIITNTYQFSTMKTFDPSLIKLDFSSFLSMAILDGASYDRKPMFITELCAHPYERPTAGIIVNF